MRALSAADAQEAAQCRARGEPFWVDVQAAGRIDELDGLADALGLSADVVEGLREFGQPPSFARREDHALLVFYGARIDERRNAEPVEVHLLVAQRELVTVHRAPAPALSDLHDEYALHWRLAAPQLLAHLSHSVVQTLEEIDDEVDELEDAIIDKPTDGQVRRLRDLRRALIELRRTITPQRDLFLRELDALAAVPGLSAAVVKDVQTRLVLARDMIDSTRELSTGALDLYQSTVSTRLNITGERLAVIATLVLPLAVVTGFFGQNFGWLVNRIDTFLAFAVLGIGAPLLVVGGLLYYLRRQGYL